MSEHTTKFKWQGKVIDNSGISMEIREPLPDEDTTGYLDFDETFLSTASLTAEDNRIPVLETEIGALFHDTVMTEIKAMEVPWSMMADSEQIRIVERVDRRKTAMLQEVVPVLAGHEFTTVRATLGDIAIKPKEIAAKVSFDKASPDRHDLFDHSGGQVLISLLDPRSFDAVPDSDQDELPFGPGGSE